MSETNSSNRSMKEIIAEATDKELDEYGRANITPDELRVIIDKGQRSKRRSIRRITVIAALFTLAAVGVLMGFELFTADVDADKNGKEEILTEDGVVIEDGGWSGESEHMWEVTDWEEVENVKSGISQLIIPEGIPKEYIFEKLLVCEMQNAVSIQYIFLNNIGKEIIFQQYVHEENLESIELYNNNKRVETSKGNVYFSGNETGTTATIQIDDGCIVEIFSELTDDEIIKIIENSIR